MYQTTIMKLLAPVLKLTAILSTVLLLQACSGGSGGGASEREGITENGSSTSFTYSGPVPANSEIQNFKTAFYDNVVIRCGSCHTSSGAGTTAFVDQDDVNFAWEEAKKVANLLDPSASQLVGRLENGHNCWLSSNATCATSMTGYIERWAQGASQSVSTITLLPRSPRDMSDIKILPATYADYISAMNADAGIPNVDPAIDGNLLSLLKTHCADCHAGSAVTPQSPYFASSDVTVAYAAMAGKVDLAVPSQSRFVLRLQDRHNCWSADCNTDAMQIQNAIAGLSDDLPLVSLDGNLVVSMAQILEEDGIVASSGGRFEDDVIAKWEFREGEGNLVADTSGVQPEITLTLLNEYEWFGGWGVTLAASGRAQAAVSASSKLHQRIAVAGEYSIEAWIVPNNVVQENAWVFGYAGGPQSRNMLLTQTMYNYDFYNRSTANNDGAGGPPTSTEDADEIAQASLQHVVLTYDPINGRKIYVNGIDTNVVDDAGPGNLTNWSDAFALVMGSNFAGSSSWAGVIRMVAIHSRSLTPAQILQNKDVGVGQKFYLMFSVADYVNDSGACRVNVDGVDTDYCYLVFQVSQFDNTSYLFTEPRFVNINPTMPDADIDFDLKGVYLGLNGQLARTGQGFVNINTLISGNSFTIDDEPLQQAGSIVPLENGPDKDVFFLAFADINGNVDGRGTPAVGSYAYNYRADPAVGQESVLIGMRIFDEINQSFSWITGVPVDSSVPSAATGKTVSQTFSSVRRSLPSQSDFQTYMASHQMAVMQLAAAYCDALVEDTGLSNVMFNGFDTSVAVESVANSTWSSRVIDPLINKVYATGLESQPNRPDDGNDTDDRDDYDDLHAALLTLIVEPADRDNEPGIGVDMRRKYLDGKADGLKYCTTNPCPAGRTAEVVKAVCTAVLSSAPATVK